jgi:beta-mannosidase
VLSWSVLDYNGFPKASYYFLRRVYAPLLASFKPRPDGGMELWLTNDTLRAVVDQVTVRLGTFDGQTHWQQTRELGVGPGASARAWTWSADDLRPATREAPLPAPDRATGLADQYLSVRSASNAFPANRHFFAEFKDLVRQPTPPTMHINRLSAHAARVELRAPDDRYVYFAHLTSADETTRFSDNYIDLQPGEVRLLDVNDPVHELHPERLHLAWA